RFPLKKPSRHGSILSRESPADKKQKVERCSSTHDFDPTGLVQRCVVIQRDENGFGLTVSGDNPVFVQSVKEGESSPQTCQDLLEMVNGTLVTHSNHLEVVKLIKCKCDSLCLQINGQCSCFQNIELLKSRPAHLAVLLHHVVSQFDPAALLCYLYTDLYKQTNSKETRRVFLEFYQFFLDRAANLKVPVPEEISLELDRRRPELLPEELHRQFIQTMQDKVCPEVQRNLEDFRQKRSMGLTLAEGELSRLDAERLRDRNAVERERSCAEQILAKIEEVLMTSQPLEEDKSSTMQYVILTYMKHLGVKVKEPRNLEQKRGRIGFLPKIKQSIKKEKEGEEKGKRRGFPNILGPPRRPSRHDSSASASPLCPETPPASESMDGTPRTPNNTFEFPSPLENLQEEEGEAERMVDMGTPKPFRKMDSVGFADVQSEDELYDFDMDMDPPNWQQLVSREVLMGLKPYEIKRQEVINELFYTERAHVRTLKVLHNVFYQRVTREGILSSSDKRKIFSNLEDILGLHVALNDQMKSVRKRNETSVIGQIGEDLLSWFSGAAEEKLKLATATFCSNQPFALEVIKSRQKKDSRFQTFVQDAESNPLCRRLQLKDIIPTEMQRLTKYPLLLDNIAKYTELPEEKEKVKKAADHCRQILNHVNQAVKESENKQHLEDYQRRLDLSYLKQSEDPMMDEFRNLDLTKRKMLHEGPLTWKVNRDKTIDLYTLLLEDILVLLQKQDDKLVLKCHSKILASTADSKHTFSPIIKLNTVLVRQVATDNKAFFVISMSATGAHIYELVAQTVSEKNVILVFPEWNFLHFYHCCFTRIFVFCPPDKDLGLESPLILNPQSSSPILSEKAKVEGLLEGQFEKGPQAELALKDSSGCSSASVPEGQWARDALRNCEYPPARAISIHFPFPIPLGWVSHKRDVAARSCESLHSLGFRHLLVFLGFSVSNEADHEFLPSMECSDGRMILQSSVHGATAGQQFLKARHSALALFL
uniref:Rho guanine nucleotide exchange factor 12 n=1 Tax=Zonotrichia albicollis TaxID=44394 RepID=A0A8D2MR38_ZONAL